MPRVGGGLGRPPKKPSSKESVSSGPGSHDSESEVDSTSLRSGEPDHSYTAPQWLLHDKLTPKFFSVPIPPVDPATVRAVQRLKAPESATQRKLRKQANQVLENIRQLQHDQKTQAKRVKIQAEKLSKALARKQMGLEEIRREKEQELDLKLKEVEIRVRNEEEAKFKGHEEALMQEIRDKFEKDFEAKQTTRKRQMEEESKAKEEVQQEKRERLEQESKKDPESEKLKAKVDELQTKLDKLQEKKSEMVWLLKQVIKADAKRNLEILKLKKAAASTGS